MFRFYIFPITSLFFVFLCFIGYKLLTTNLTATIKNLEACESYMFAVGVIGNYGAGPLHQPVSVTTHFNKRAPPKRLRVTPTPDKNDSIIVSWSASCPTIDEPISYTVSRHLIYNGRVITYLYLYDRFTMLLTLNLKIIFSPSGS